MKGIRINPRTLLAISYDAVVASISWAAAFWLRLNLSLPAPYDSAVLNTVLIVIGVQLSIFLLFGLYRGIWRYASLHDFRRILMAVGLGALAVPFVLMLLGARSEIPRSVYLLDPLLLVGFMGTGRFAYRLWKDSIGRQSVSSEGVPLLVLGVNDLAERLVRELESHRRWKVVGLLDHERRRLGREIHGVRVIGQIKNVGRIAHTRGVDHVVLTIPNTQAGLRRRAMQLAAGAGLRVLSAPSFEELLTGKVAITQLRNVDIEDLLGRTTVTLESADVSHMIQGRCVMVTGAGGSIGSELARQIADFKPARLVLLDVSEFSLFNVEQHFQRQFPSLPIICATGDVKDSARMADIMTRHQPRILFHAAAYKHVPLMEVENAWEAIRNNVLGTWVTARAAVDAGLEKFVLVSTDKAVNPTNVMGASKRLAEMICQGLQENAATRFVTVRFGNVLGSAGSVVPKFREQIAQGGPVTVTHPDVTRFFMSIPEAAQLVLKAAAVGDSGEVFVLDMGEPVRIADLARDMIRLSGLTEEDVPVVYTGLRPGEKLYEELLSSDEHTMPTRHPKLRIARARPADARTVAAIVDWVSATRVHSDEAVRARLCELVPEYAPTDNASAKGTASGHNPVPLRIVVNR